MFKTSRVNSMDSILQMVMHFDLYIGKLILTILYDELHVDIYMLFLITWLQIVEEIYSKELVRTNFATRRVMMLEYR